MPKAHTYVMPIDLLHFYQLYSIWAPVTNFLDSFFFVDFYQNKILKNICLKKKSQMWFKIRPCAKMSYFNVNILMLRKNGFFVKTNT